MFQVIVENGEGVLLNVFARVVPSDLTENIVVKYTLYKGVFSNKGFQFSGTLYNRDINYRVTSGLERLKTKFYPKTLRAVEFK